MMPIVRRDHKGIEINMLAVLKMLWKRKWIILLSGVVIASLAYLVTVIFITPEYVTSATLYANNSNSTDGTTSISTSQLSASARLVDTYAAIILSDPVLDQVIQDNNLNTTASALANRITISSVNETEVFKITVKYPSAKEAAQIANSISDIAPEKIGEIVDGCSIKLVNYAKVPAGSTSPNYNNNIKIGFLFGILLSAMMIFIVAVVDTRVKGETDLNEWEYPVLGVIPSFDAAEKTGAYGYRNRENGKNELNQ